MTAWMEIRQLKYFAKVCEDRSFTKAAAAVGVSQPALSQSIKDLERQLDTILLYRGIGATHPTPEGEALLGFANAIVQQHDNALAELKRIRNEGNGLVTLGVHSAFPRSLIVRAMEQFQKHYPQVEVRLRSAAFDHTDVGKRLGENEWDAAVVPYQASGQFMTDEKWTTRFNLRRIISTTSHVYASKTHPLAAIAAPTVDDLLEYTWVLGYVGTAELLTEYAKESGSKKQVKIGLITDAFGTMLETVARTEMVCIAPEQLVEESGQPLVRLEQSMIPHLPINWGIMTDSSLELPRPARFLVACLLPE